MTHPLNLVIFGPFLRGGPNLCLQQKLFRHGFEHSCSAMATPKFEEKVQQHDVDADCRLKQNWLQEPIEGT